MNRLSYHLGNALIVLSLAGFLYTFYPFLQMYLTPSLAVSEIENHKGIFITIPRINAQSQILKNIDPWNETVYNQALKKGVAHAKGTALPGDSGTSFLFAHSSALPWEMTRNNTIFLRLGELQKGDEVRVTRDGEDILYKVRETKEVWPDEVEYLLKNEKDLLILQTCTPIGTSLKRLLVFAQRS